MRTIGDKLLLYNLHIGHVWMFNKSTREVLDLVNGQNNVGQICQIISNKYDVELAMIEKDIFYILNVFIHLKFIKFVSNCVIYAEELKLENDVQQIIHYTKENNIIFNALVELLYDCNLTCQHCYVDNCPKNTLSYEEVIHLLDELVQMGTPKVTFSGGEIFLRKDLLPILKAAVEKGFLVSMISNGTLLTDEMIAELSGIPMEAIKISLYGTTEDSHESVTGVKHSFKQSLLAIKKMVHRGMKVVINCILMQDNFEQAESIRALAENLGCHYMLDFRILPKRSGSEEPQQLSISQSQLATLFRRNLVAPITYVDCSAGFNKAVITPVGDVMPCESLMYYRMGNIRETSLQNIWSGDKASVFRRHVKSFNPKECYSCDYRDHCPKCPATIWKEQLFANSISRETMCKETRTFHLAMQRKCDEKCSIK